MRKSAYIAPFAIIIVTLAATAASAQLNQRYRAEIPFDFSIGKSDMKSGNYALGFFNDTSSTPVLGIINRDTGRVTVLKPIVRSGTETRSNAVMKFLKSGGHYDLAEIQGKDFEKKFSRTWSDVRQVTKAPSADTETVTIYLN